MVLHGSFGAGRAFCDHAVVADVLGSRHWTALNYGIWRKCRGSYSEGYLSRGLIAWESLSSEGLAIFLATANTGTIHTCSFSELTERSTTKV